MTATQITRFDGKPLLSLTKWVYFENGNKGFACAVCGEVYLRRSCARVCCGETKYKANLAYWWPSRKIFKPVYKPIGRLNGDGELTLYERK